MYNLELSKENFYFLENAEYRYIIPKRYPYAICLRCFTQRYEKKDLKEVADYNRLKEIFNSYKLESYFISQASFYLAIHKENGKMETIKFYRVPGCGSECIYEKPTSN